MNLKMFCILCLILYFLIILCIILCDTSKASENLTFVLKQSHSVECVLLSSGCHEDQRLCRTNYIRFISNCDMPEEVSVTFDPKVDFNDDAVDRSHYEQFYSVRSNYARENPSL